MCDKLPISEYLDMSNKLSNQLKFALRNISQNYICMLIVKQTNVLRNVMINMFIQQQNIIR